jgi:hypothetical protein
MSEIAHKVSTKDSYVSSGSSAVSDNSLIFILPRTVSNSTILGYDDFSTLLEFVPK